MEGSEKAKEEKGLHTGFSNPFVCGAEKKLYNHGPEGQPSLGVKQLVRPKPRCKKVYGKASLPMDTIWHDPKANGDQKDG